jgi:glycosyltransferase involved in cell wall biosynthesis
MVSVVIATYNRPGPLTRCVHAVLAGTVAPSELIVVDQSEGDETEHALEELGEPAVRHVRHRPPSTSAARNLGLGLARGDYAAILDDDVEVPSDWLESLRAELALRPEIDALFGQLLPGEPLDHDSVPVSVFTIDEPRSWTARTFPDRLGFSAHMVIRRSAFARLGGFDERLGPGTRFFAAEDMDLNYRLLSGGHQAVSTPAVWATHHQWRRPEDVPELYYRYGVGQAAFCAKHLRAGDLFAARILARHLAGDLRMAASAARRRSLLRARIAWARARGTGRGLASGWRAFRAS